MYVSKADDKDWKYPQTEPYASGCLDVENGTHRVFGLSMVIHAVSL